MSNEKPIMAHWVPASYLKKWAGRDDTVTVLRLVGGKPDKHFPKNPEKIFRKPDLYKITDEGFTQFGDLVEKTHFAEISEKMFCEIASTTLDQGKVPDQAELRFLADYCFELLIRNPHYIKLREEQIEAHHPEHASLLKTSIGIRTSVSIIAIRSEFKYRNITLVKAPPETQFLTSDTPCWPWLHVAPFSQNKWDETQDYWGAQIAPSQWIPIESFKDFPEPEAFGANVHHVHVCALSPRWALVSLPLVTKEEHTPHFDVVENDLSFVNQLNAQIFQVARDFIVFPPPLAEQNEPKNATESS